MTPTNRTERGSIATTKELLVDETFAYIASEDNELIIVLSGSHETEWRRKESI